MNNYIFNNKILKYMYQLLDVLDVLFKVSASFVRNIDGLGNDIPATGGE